MTLSDYQTAAMQTAIYPKPHSLPLYPARGLCGEAGEVAEKIKKMLRDGCGPDANRDIASELGDVLWYVSALASDLGWSLSSIAEMNLEKLASRKQRDVIRGDGDNR